MINYIVIFTSSLFTLDKTIYDTFIGDPVSLPMQFIGLKINLDYSRNENADVCRVGNPTHPQLCCGNCEKSTRKSLLFGEVKTAVAKTPDK